MFRERFSIEKPRVRAESSHYLLITQKSQIDLSRTSGKNPSEGLVRPVQEFAKAITKTSSKVCKSKTYDKISKLLYGNR